MCNALSKEININFNYVKLTGLFQRAVGESLSLSSEKFIASASFLSLVIDAGSIVLTPFCNDHLDTEKRPLKAV